MAEIVDFGLQQHKIKMDSRYFENVLSVVAGDTGRRIEVQLLDTNGMVQDTTGLNLRLNAEIAGKATFTDATLVDAATGKYQLDLSNGMFLAPGNWQFQWQITDSVGKKLHSFAFTGNVGKNISEGGSQATNFYLNLEDLKKMQDDLINGTIDLSILETNIVEKLTNLETIPQNSSVTYAKLSNGLKNKSFIKKELPSYRMKTVNWIGNGVIYNTSGYKITYHDTVGIDYVTVSGKNKANRDFLAGYKLDGTYVSSLKNDTATDIIYTDYLLDVSAFDYVILSMYDDDNSFVSKISSLVGASQVNDDYESTSLLESALELLSIEKGYVYQKGVKNALSSGKIYYYDLQNVNKFRIAGVNSISRDFVTFFDSSGAVVDFYFNKLTTSMNFDYDVSKYAKLAVSDDIYKAEPPFKVYKKIGFTEYANNTDETSDYNGNVMQWGRVEAGGYQNSTLWNSTTVFMRVYDVSSMSKVRVKSKTGANLNSYTKLKDGVVVGYTFNSSPVSVDYDVVVDVSDADEIWVSYRSNDETVDSACYSIEEDTLPKKWKNKSILWLGTSIPAHGAFGEYKFNAYPQIVGGQIGATVINNACGESVVSAKDYTLISAENPYGFVSDFRRASRCLTNTVVEMQWIIDNFNIGVFTTNVPTSIDTATADGIKARSYENRLLPFLNSVDLFVLDHGHNDFGNTGTHKYDDLIADYGEKNLYSYVGGMNFIMDLIKTNNPKAKVVQISDYSYKLPYVIDMQEKFTSLWNIPFLKLCDLTGWSQMKITVGGQQKTIQQHWLPDDLHPHSDLTGSASFYLADIIRDYFLYTLY